MSDSRPSSHNCPRGIRRISRLFLVLLLPLLFISTAVRLEMSSPGLYERGFEKYEISASTRLDDAQLSEIAGQLIGYFNSTCDTPQMQVTTTDGTKFALFHDYELIHLSDVKALFTLNSTIQSILLLLIVVLLLATFSSCHTRWKRDIAKALQQGAVLTLIALVLVSILFAADFNWMFVGFHLVAFDNSFWLLDPHRDFLVILFPLGFWEDMFMLAGIMTAAFAATTFATTRIVNRLVHKHGSEPMAIDR